MESKPAPIRTTFSAFWRGCFPDRADLPLTLTVLAITLAGLLFRLAYLRQPVGFDEAYTYLAFSTQPIIHIFTDYSYPNNHIFHTLLVALTSRALGINAVWVMRLPALITGVLIIPAAYLAGRQVYNARAGMIAALLTAVAPQFINFSAEARGYTLLCLAALILVWLAARLLQQSHWSGWAVFCLTGILGALTIPIMLYPLAAVFVWMVCEILLRNGWKPFPIRALLPVFGSAALTFMGTIVVYLPVILYGTGYRSLTSNNFVAPEAWPVFWPDFINRLQNTWGSWYMDTSIVLAILSVIGFAVSLLLHRRGSSTRLHLAIPTVVVIFTIVIVQRVAPMPRIWQFLQGWFDLWVGAGLAWLLGLIPGGRWKHAPTLLLAALTLFALADRTIQVSREAPKLSQPGVEESVAHLLKDQVHKGDLIVTVIPMSTQIKYYYNQLDDYRSWFYNSGQNQTVSQVLVVVNAKYDETLESNLSRNKLLDRVDMNQAVQTAAYKQVVIYRIPILTAK
jgi:hypothetical protein